MQLLFLDSNQVIPNSTQLKTKCGDLLSMDSKVVLITIAFCIVRIFLEKLVISEHVSNIADKYNDASKRYRRFHIFYWKAKKYSMVLLVCAGRSYWIGISLLVVQVNLLFHTFVCELNYVSNKIILISLVE